MLLEASMKAVLVGVDGSDGSRRAAELAKVLADAAGVSLSVIHVVEPLPDSTARALGFSLEDVHDRRLREGQRILDEMCDDLGVGQAGRVLEAGRAAETICAAAAELGADHIVVGAHGHGPYRRLPGAVGSRLLNMASGTLTVVR